MHRIINGVFTDPHKNVIDLTISLDKYGNRNYSKSIV